MCTYASMFLSRTARDNLRLFEPKSKAPTPAEVGAFFMLSKLEPFLIAAIAKCS